MAVKRVWFPNIPDGSLEYDDRSQIIVGYPIGVSVTPPVDNGMEKYMRRYLNDPTELPIVGPTVISSTTPETSVTRYLRRYLVDPKE